MDRTYRTHGRYDKLKKIFFKTREEDDYLRDDLHGRIIFKGS